MLGIDVAQRGGASGALYTLSEATEVRFGLTGSARLGTQEILAAAANADVAEVNSVARSGLRKHAAGDDVECADARGRRRSGEKRSAGSLGVVVHTFGNNLITHRSRRCAGPLPGRVHRRCILSRLRNLKWKSRIECRWRETCRANPLVGETY